MKIRFSVIMALAAFILSILIGFLVGNYIINILLKAVAFSLLFAALTYGVLDFLEKKVPEFFQIFSGLGSASALKSDESESAAEYSAGNEKESMSEEGVAAPDLGQEADLTKSELQDAGLSKKGLGNLGSHIMVKDKKIINEPKLMAEAIKTMMARDSE